MILALFLAAQAMASANFTSDEALERELQKFSTNTAESMNAVPVKKNIHGEILPPTTQGLPFDFRTRSRIKIMRQSNLQQSNNGFAVDSVNESYSEPISNDRVEMLVDNADNVIRNLKQMEDLKLNAAILPKMPWSDSYWPIYQGQLGRRYADPYFPAADDWKANYQYVSSNPASKILMSANPELIGNLSPSEKYDLWTGKSSSILPLTAQMWAAGKTHYEANGLVETWMGLCHGWAAAAFMLDRPIHKTFVKAADGKTDLEFFPADIRALATLLWAEAPHRTKFIGGRCNDKDPQQDPNGRILVTDCFDTNPATWHMTVVNQIGVSRRSMVIDATYDYEVWNQPVYSYTYRYFNPQTLKAVSNLNSGTVAIEKFTNDKFKKYRSKKARYVVGVAMDLTYVVENQPVHEDVESEDDSSLRNVNYRYDLEIDESGNVIGGEWYQNLHPDFIWTPDQYATAETFAEGSLRNATFDSMKALPANFRDAATQASAYNMPLKVLVNSLINWSRH